MKLEAAVAKSIIKNISIIHATTHGRSHFAIKMIEPGRFSVLFRDYSFSPANPAEENEEIWSGGFGLQREIDVIEIPGMDGSGHIAMTYLKLIEQAKRSSDPLSTLTNIELREFLNA